MSARHRPLRPRRRARGVALIMALIALLVISFAAAALLRSTDTATLITGNLGFKKTALGSGDAANEVAMNWLLGNANTGALFNDNAANGYYATSADGCDLTGAATASPADDVAWSGTAANACNMRALAVSPAGVADGYTVAYVINRLCNAEGDPGSLLAADGVTAMACSRAQGGANEGSTRSGGFYGNLPLSGATQTYYRITTRIAGPRNTVRFVQAFVVL